LKTVSALGAFGTTAITALTAQNTVEVRGVFEVPAAFVAAQIEACLDDIGCDAAKTGMLASAAIVETVAAVLAARGPFPLVVDPAMIAKSGAPLLAPSGVEALKTRLLPLATVVTPNLHEASSLVGREIRSLEAMREAAREIHGFGPAHVVVKGGHLEGPPVDLLFDGRTFVELAAERVDTRHTHGTGCIFASAIAAFLARGLAVPEAVARAKEFVTAAIRGGLALGRGHGPADPLAGPAEGIRRPRRSSR
jgi:hydroxymethylpyrimidine/phosphomethylpyrimidine kinase